jgi:hypothetical protein
MEIELENRSLKSQVNELRLTQQEQEISKLRQELEAAHKQDEHNKNASLMNEINVLKLQLDMKRDFERQNAYTQNKEPSGRSQDAEIIRLRNDIDTMKS